MQHPLSKTPSRMLALSVALVTVGVVVADGFGSTFRAVPALALIVVGIAGVAGHAGEKPVGYLRPATRRWWSLALAAFIPYGLITSPSSESAAAVGDALSVGTVATILEGFAGASLLCAVTVTVLYGFARYGIHPNMATPEERILEE